LVTSRILTRRRLSAGARGLPATRRRRSAHLALGVAPLPAAAARLRLSAFGRLYLLTAAVLAVVLGYLVVAGQATQSSYELSTLQRQRAELRAEQDQLRYQAMTMRTPARIDQEAAQAGLQRTLPAKYVAYQPVAIDLAAPTGADLPDASPLWQRALAAVIGGTGASRDVMAGDR